MSRPVSAMMAMARSRLTPGISASRAAAGSTAAPGPGSAQRVPSAVDAPGGGDGLQGGGDLVLDRADGAVQERRCGPGGSRISLAWCGAERHALQGRLQVGRGGPAAGPAPRAARACGSRLPAGHGLQDEAGGLDLRQRRQLRRQLDQGAFQQLLQPLPRPRCGRGPGAAACGSGRAAPGSPAAARTRGAAGPSRPAGPATARPAGRSSAARPAAGPGRSSPAAPPARATRAGSTRSASNPTSTPSPPARPRRPAAARQRPGPPAARRRDASSTRDRRRPPSRGRRQPGAHVRLRLRDVDPRDPLVAELVVLVLHQLRGNLPRPRVPHRGLLSLNRVTQAGCPGTPVSWLSAANTDRRAQGNKRRPSGQVPAPGFATGSHPTRDPASRAARPHPAPHPPPPQPDISPAAAPSPGRRRPAAPRKFSRQRDRPRRECAHDPADRENPQPKAGMG